ncbi:MAG: DUF423 domain-containing protein [Verrucomicrobiota bacterium]
MSTRTPATFALAAAGILGLTGVALGAFGAHALKATLLERGMTVAWETGSRYHLLHAVALLGLAGWLRATPAGSGNAGGLLWAARLWCLGTVMFSGSLYWLAVGGPRWLGPITPFGGVALMGGWLLVLVAAFAKPRG